MKVALRFISRAIDRPRVMDRPWSRPGALAALVLIGTVVGSAAEPAHAGRAGSHVVESGETLWDIARDHGCTIKAVKQANKLERDLIRPGQKLAIPSCKGKGKRGGKGKSGGAVFLTHYVMPGESLNRIAKRYDTTVANLKKRNRLKGNLIRPGQKLRVVVGKDGRGRGIAGQSVGRADRGKLINGMQLPRARGYHRRRPTRAWGANHTIFHIRNAVRTVRARFPKVHDLAVGDISSRKGGKLSLHKSHQSGRDVDLGFYFTRRPKGYPKSFIEGTRKNLDMRANWALFKAFADTADAPSGVEKIFLDYELQEVFYKWAQERKVKKKTLDKMFQYPHGRGASRGIFRHEPGHDDHIHVRFKCPQGDKACNS